ncbi:hypothetical protein ACFO3I_00755 [Rheinheimera marina]|uniref:DUF3037 domain-containing protein n=1 Tax=Rheinheimera marina TaxID=1774958 RepID=A0ABV9JGN5_9GAMM
MNTLESLFPSNPNYAGRWHAIYLEPIVGSGEKISIGVLAIGADSQYKVIQAIRAELLDCLYGSQAENMQSMIDWVLTSAREELKQHGTICKWSPPFSGVKLSKEYQAADENIEGILKQAIRFTSSLSTLALDAEREDDEYQPRKYSEHWTKSISDELKIIAPHFGSNFNRKIKVGDANILTTYGFLTDQYVTNFGLLIPTRLSASLNTIKAKLFDLETLKRSNLLIKPEKYEIIIGTPSFNDPTLSDKSIKRLKETLGMISELSEDENIGLFQAESASQAANHIFEVAA